MRKLILYIMCVVAVSLFSCTPTVENAKKVDRRPSIYPDYLGVTIPAGIAPLNFTVIGKDVDAVDVVARGSKGGEIHVAGDYAKFDIDEWHELTEKNAGGNIRNSPYMSAVIALMNMVSHTGASRLDMRWEEI